ncbi:MAG: Outer membrane protein (OmpH-like) [Bacteroidetes bacterium ADurb.Bin408]|nr:MAG: Outer membrane protein (OmpH-like) [Bacteroidetes bacterium ADurb.Bin408]
MEENTNQDSFAEEQDQKANTPEISQPVQPDCCDNKKETCCASTWNLIFKAMSLLTFVGVIILFIIYFSNNKNGINKTTALVKPDGAPLNIAFINSDTIMNQYKLFDDYEKKLEERKKQMEADMAIKAKKFEQDVADFQKKVQSYAISSDQAQKIEADLTQRQQQLLALKEKLTNELLEMEMAHQNDLFNKILETLKEYNKENQYDYILGYSKGSGILYASEKHDITQPILEMLNKEYDNKKK